MIELRDSDIRMLEDKLLDVIPDYYFSEGFRRFVDPFFQSSHLIINLIERIYYSLEDFDGNGAWKINHILDNMVYGICSRNMSNEDKTLHINRISEYIKSKGGTSRFVLFEDYQDFKRSDIDSFDVAICRNNIEGVNKDYYLECLSYVAKDLNARFIVSETKPEYIYNVEDDLNRGYIHFNRFYRKTIFFEAYKHSDLLGDFYYLSFSRDEPNPLGLINNMKFTDNYIYELLKRDSISNCHIMDAERDLIIGIIEKTSYGDRLSSVVRTTKKPFDGDVSINAYSSVCRTNIHREYFKLYNNSNVVGERFVKVIGLDCGIKISNFYSYSRSNLFNFLLLIREIQLCRLYLSSSHFDFIPLIDFDNCCNSNYLYEKFNIDTDEREFIDSFFNGDRTHNGFLKPTEGGK